MFYITTILLLLVCVDFALMQPVAISQTSRTTLPTTTTTSMPSIENPTELESTSETSEEDPYRCFKCYEQITESQRMLLLYENLQKQERAHLKEKASKVALSTTSISKPSGKPKQSTLQNAKNQTANASNLRSMRDLDRTLSDSSTENKPIVVSRLRVARSPPTPISELDEFLPLLDNNRNYPKNNVDPVLKKLKLQQKQQHNKTCKELQKLKTCLFDLSKDCLGNLQFHTMEVFTKQWDNKLDCKTGQFKNLARSLIPFEEPLKSPIPRKISTRNETVRKINDLFPSRGVMLSPTLPTYRSQKGQFVDQQHQQQLQYISSQKTSQLKNYNGFVDISGVQVPFVGQLLLLIPCLAIAVMALIALINITICHAREEAKN